VEPRGEAHKIVQSDSYGNDDTEPGTAARARAFPKTAPAADRCQWRFREDHNAADIEGLVIIPASVGKGLDQLEDGNQA
jgi:hypothetical protein